jgi:hypothetical protein
MNVLERLSRAGKVERAEVPCQIAGLKPPPGMCAGHSQ